MHCLLFLLLLAVIAVVMKVYRAEMGIQAQGLDWALLDGELLPWALKAGSLIAREFAIPGRLPACHPVSQKEKWLTIAKGSVPWPHGSTATAKSRRSTSGPSSSCKALPITLKMKSHDSGCMNALTAMCGVFTFACRHSRCSPRAASGERAVFTSNIWEIT